MKVYLSGPMTGWHDNNRQTFDACQKRLEERGLQVVSPIELDWSLEREHEFRDDPPPSREDYLRHDIRHLLDCEVILMLPLWHTSKGAAFERVVALNCGIRVVYGEGDLP